MTQTLNTQKIPFKVSARTARLIGRENIATSKGAIIELVKNGYDADSPFVIVYFDNYYAMLHDEITIELYNELISKSISKELLDVVYFKDTNNYKIRNNIDENFRIEIKNKILRLSSLYIIDVGEGMTQNIIRNYWMTIGTDNKTSDVFTKSGRIKAGAKGIGRFALDKLGEKCEMITIFNPQAHEIDVDEEGNQTNFNGYRWLVNWQDFEGESKTIENVNAELLGLEKQTLTDYLEQFMPENILNQFENTDSKNYNYGTILKITGLRDNWEDYYVNQVYSDLEVLVPPKENNEFNIYLLSSLEPQKYGEVVGSVCDDFDYKLIASADEKQNVHIKIIRNEYDLDLIPKDFFNRSNMKKEKKYTEESFRKSYWETTMTFSQLLPGFKTIDYDKVFNNIGVFEFSFYYLKRTYATKDAERFFYRLFNSNDRKIWLDKFGGIKLFRDNFRVRPYGEKQDVAFDWLNLGSRKAKSPAGISKSDGGYRVEPDNVAGAIKISRLTNVNFEDKSSREGLQDNKTFQIFKSLISNIISIFELDRSYIAKEMDAFYDEQYGPIIAKKEAEDIAKKILEEHRKKLSEQKVFNNKEFEDEKDRNLTIIAHLNEQKDEEIEKLKEEQILLRGLASCGLALASFSHDLSKITDVLEYRFDKFRNLISDKLSEANYIGVEDRKNPFRVLERMKKDDIKMKTWLNFSLGFTRKDKRNRKQVFLKKYFDKLKSDWETVFQSRGINIDLSNIADITMRIFEIDLDSIFTNLFVNSIDAFNSLKENRTREIKILINATLKGINIDYYDNGTGLSKDISAPEIIFKPMFTTKKNQYTGEDEGTGLGMWIVKSIVEENDGQIKLLFPKIGFSIRMIFPIKYGRQGNV